MQEWLCVLRWLEDVYRKKHNSVAAYVIFIMQHEET